MADHAAPAPHRRRATDGNGDQMGTRTRPSLVLLASLALALTACTSSPQGPAEADGALLRIGSSESVATLDYAKSNLGYHGLGNLVLEPLVVATPDGEFGPWLAESWSQSSDTTYVYTLRSDVKFSDGAPLTADDVVTTMNYYRSDGSLNAYNFPPSFEGVRALDETNVEFEFSTPFPAWNSTLSAAALGIFQKKYFEDNRGTFGQPGTGVIGTGPWKVDNLDPTTGASLSANEHYWGGEVPFAKLDFNFFANDTSAAVALRTGEIDIAFPQDPRTFESTAGRELTTSDSGVDSQQLYMNTLVPPWDDVHVRRAVAYALDKEALINAAGVVGAPMDTIIPRDLLQQLGTPEEVDAALADVPMYPFDLDKAKAEMAKSDYPDGVNVTFATIKSVSKTNQAVVAQLAKIGISAELETQTDDQNNAELTGADRKAIRTQVSPFGGSGIDPGLVYDWMLGSANAKAGGWNATNWSTPEVDQLIADGLSESDPATRLEIYGRLLKEYGEAMPIVPLFTVNETVALGDGFAWPDFSAGSRSNRGPWALAIEQS